MKMTDIKSLTFNIIKKINIVSKYNIIFQIIKSTPYEVKPILYIRFKTQGNKIHKHQTRLHKLYLNKVVKM